MRSSLETLNILETKLNLADRECEEEASRRINEMRSSVRYENGRLRVPNFQEAANTLVRVIYCKEKRFCAEICRVLSGPERVLESADVERAEKSIASYFDESRYRKSFESFVASVERRAKSYGVPFDSAAYRVDFFEAAYKAGIQNGSRRALASVRAELALSAHGASMHTGGANASEDIIELKPNFMGFGLNLRALIRRFLPCKREKT